MTKLLNTDDAAAYLNISTSTLAKMRLSGQTPKFVKVGRRVGYRVADLESWIEAQCFHSTAEYSERI